MAREPAPAPINYAGTNYDALETALSERLNLKTIILPRRENPFDVTGARLELWHTRNYGTPEAQAVAQVKFQQVEEASLGLLRSQIAEKDAVVAATLTDNDLRSLQKLGHVTQRGGNTEPEQAVIIFDPDPVALYSGLNVQNPLLRATLQEHFDNAWVDPLGEKEEGRHLDVADFIENFDISRNDYRIYKAVQNVRYALQNQSEYNNWEKGWYYEPAYYKFAGLDVNNQSAGMYRSDSELPLHEVAEKYEYERWSSLKNMGVQDKELFRKLALASAIKSLVWNASPPTETFARLGLHQQVSPQQMVEIQKDLADRLAAKKLAHRPRVEETEEYRYGLDKFVPQDFRILFPLFREVYAEDKSTGPARQYLDAINAALQKWFPTLTNGPVPGLSNSGTEPPRALVKEAPAAEEPKLKKAFKGDKPKAG